MVHHSIRQRPSLENASVRLFCLPFAGGGSAPFFRWKQMLPDSINIVPLTLPGHDGRLNERPLTDLRTLAGLLADDLQTTIADQPFALLGHSMGAWLAFEMLRVLRRRSARMPVLLVVAASRAPHLPLADEPIHDLPDEEFLNSLEQRYGGIAPEVRGSPELLRLLLPALRADIQMVETYQYTDEPPLDVEILAQGGTDDAAVSAAQLDAWQRHSARSCSIRLLPGGHFFLFGTDRGVRPADQTVRASEPSPALQMIIARIEQLQKQPLACSS